MALDELISGISADKFYSSFWDKMPFVSRGPLERFRLRYSTKYFESRLTESDLRAPHLKLALNGEIVDSSRYTYSRRIGGHLCDDFVDVPAVYGLWNQGATIIQHALATSAPTLIPWLRTLELELGHPVQANAYLTPKSSHGFGIHFDTHDVFIVQVEGQKHWRIWADPAEPKPLPDDRSPKVDGFTPPGQILFDGTLEEGSVVYIPRGYYHEARSNDVSSLHITIGVLVYRKIDALKSLLRVVLDEIESSNLATWRDALMPGYIENGDADFDSLRDFALSKISSAWGVSSTVRDFREQIRPINQHLLDRSNVIEQIDLDTNLTLMSTTPTIEAVNDELLVAYGGRALRLPVSTEKALRIIAARGSFTPRHLTEDYTTQSSLALCKHFVREGLVAISDSLCCLSHEQPIPA